MISCKAKIVKNAVPSSRGSATLAREYEVKPLPRCSSNL